jgi:hypothetical protein
MVADELLFTVRDGVATPANRISLTTKGLWERQHLQEWVIKHPEIIAEDARIITTEFAGWISGGNANVADRLDVLALNRSGRLIVAELKRDRAPDTVTMQAINYAAMARRFSLDTLAEVHARYLGNGTTPEEARQLLLDWADDLSDETLGIPSIVLLAGEFGPTITNASLFLYESGIDIRLRRYQLYEVETGELVFTVSQLIPVPDAEQFMVSPRSSSLTQTDAQMRKERKASLVDKLIKCQALPKGTRLRIVVPTSVQEDRSIIEAYLAEAPDRGYVEWRLDSLQPVFWLPQHRPFDLNGLVKLIITLATGNQSKASVSAPSWFRDDQGRTLTQIANSL